MQTPAHWDVFCKIVDNHGDIGVCWRLSQQLASEHGLCVRLFIDDLAAAQKIIPQLNVGLSQQRMAGVTICAWPDDKVIPAATVLETFACGLPMAFLEKMVAQQAHWINLDYLSAEDWVADFHGKPSPHPQLPITKHFFFPGFDLGTGGLLREQALIEQRSAFIQDASVQQQFWQSIGYEQARPKPENNLKISLFCYPQANSKRLIEDLVLADQSVTVFFPASLLQSADSLFPDFNKIKPHTLQKNKVTVQLLPFLSSANYDRLLWSCDLNFVRGEDSWVRALWAGQPFVWQPYIQDEDTHLKKLQAFLDCYSHNASAELTATLTAAHHTWSNAKEPRKNSFYELIKGLAEFRLYAEQQADALAQQPDLASKLLSFNEKLIKNKV